jgi:hypothetical protein
MKRALSAAAVYFLALFALGFVLGTMRVLFVAPSIGVLRATLLEVPIMLSAAFFSLPLGGSALASSPHPVGALGDGAVVSCAAGAVRDAGRRCPIRANASRNMGGSGYIRRLIGLTAQIITAMMPLFVGRNGR